MTPAERAAQRDAAMQRANEIRKRRAAVRARCRELSPSAGRCLIGQLIEVPPWWWQGAPIAEVLEYPRLMGRDRVARRIAGDMPRVLQHAKLEVRRLTPRERFALGAALRDDAIRFLHGLEVKR